MPALARDYAKKCCVALGNFDGIHRGHQAILNACVETAKKEGLLSVVWSFRRHPEHILKGNFASGNILSLFDKEELLHAMGIDQVIWEDFERVRRLSPEAFCEEVLLDRLSAGFVFCGFNFRFGKDGAGDAAFLKSYLASRGVRVFISEPVTDGGEAISSTRVRQLLQEGKTEEAARLLGRPYFIRFPVLHGRRIGSTIGFPTINQLFPDEYVTPKKGVYTVKVEANGSAYFGICNVGCRPTVGGDERVVAETHLLHYTGDLYGKTVKVEFYRFLRPEIKFASLSELKDQIERDRAAAIDYWKDPK